MTNPFEPEQRNKLALKVAEFGVWTWNVASGTIEWDGQAAKAWGLSADAHVDMSAIDALIHPEDLDGKQSALGRALDPSGDGMYRAEYRIVGPSERQGGRGDRRVISLGKAEFQDGKPVRVIGFVCDVTERWQAENAVRHSQLRLSGIVSIAADAIISIDEQQHITMFNHGAERIFGYTSEDAIGQPLAMLLPERFRTNHGAHVQQFAASDTTARHMGDRREIFGLRKDGVEFPAEASISKLLIGGECTFTVVLRDITDRKRTEQALELSNQALEARVAQRTAQLQAETERRLEAQAALSRAQRMEAFGQLAGGIAHDFNNLLTIIMGNQELLEMRLQDPKQLALLNRAQEAAEMGARLTGRLLTFARRRQLEPTLLNLNEQITGMVELLRRSIGEQVTMTTNLAPRLWTVRTDASEIESTVLNLAINARDAMQSGGTLVIETAECTIDDGEIGGESKLPGGDFVRLSVADTGTGMPPEVLARAFEPFFTTKPPGKGTGLGLSTIYGFVQQSGGAVTVYSEAGRGTTVNIYLPRAADGGSAVHAVPADAAVPVAKGESILVVEDNPAIREVAVKRIAELGYKVVEAENGPAAIAVLEAPDCGIDLVFSDVVMPGGMSGFDLARWIGVNQQGIKVLLTSGYPEQVSGAPETQRPDVKLLRKPHNRIELARALRDVLDQSQP